MANSQETWVPFGRRSSHHPQKKSDNCNLLQTEKKICKRSAKIILKRRILLYTSLVKSILLYNSETWGLSQTEEEKLNAFHRKQLRVVLNIKHPHRISNKCVYEKCSSKTLESEIKRRWELLGHILRMDKNVPV